MSESSNASSTVKKNGRAKENPFLRENGKVSGHLKISSVLFFESVGRYFGHSFVNIFSSLDKIFLQEEEIIDGEDPMKDLRTSVAGIFGEKK